MKDPVASGNEAHRWVSLAEIAQDLDVSLATVHKWSSRRQLPAIRLPNGQLRVRVDRYEAWLKSLEVA